MIELTQDQEKARDLVMDWVKTRRPLLTLGGYAGTGKSTTVGHMAQIWKAKNMRLAFCTVSGKASTVLRSKLREFLTEDDYCGTIHSLIYLLIGKEKKKNGRTELYFEPDENRHLPYDLIVVDEASMVNEWIFKDLARYGIPILAVGDHGQLPPVKGNFNLMAQPEIRLEKILRQAEGNPIIKMAMMARVDGVIKYGDYGQGCIKTKDSRVMHEHQFDSDSIMICALNKTRVRMNSFAREKSQRLDKIPMVGEPVICLYNNNRKAVYNGNIGILDSIKTVFDPETEKDVYEVSVDMGDFVFQNGIDPGHFGKLYTEVDEKSDKLDYFDWAYAITAHKSQGSEWKNVLVIEEAEFMFKGEMWNRWLYTAVTRAKERLVVFKR